jgi:hypothetical protein
LARVDPAIALLIAAWAMQVGVEAWLGERLKRLAFVAVIMRLRPA